MNSLRIEDKDWSKVKEKLKDKFAILTDSDLVYKKGNEEKLLTRIQEKTGKTKRELKTLFKKLSEE